MVNFLQWFKEFDVVKAFVLAIFAIVSSWYDLRGEVQGTKQELTSFKIESKMKDDYLESEQKATKEDVKELTKDIREDIREIRKKVDKIR